jgi:cell shape-determining protein MreC
LPRNYSSVVLHPRHMDNVATRVNKVIETKNQKIGKLQEENARLKAQLTAAKQLHSRIRRIAKKGGDADIPQMAEATATNA